MNERAKKCLFDVLISIQCIWEFISELDLSLNKSVYEKINNTIRNNN